MDLPLSTFLPQPRSVQRRGASFRPGGREEGVVSIDLPSSHPAFDRLRTAFAKGGITVRRRGEGAEIRTAIEDGNFEKAESYRLTVDGSGIRLVAGDEAGLFYGCISLAQLVEGAVHLGLGRG